MSFSMPPGPAPGVRADLRTLYEAKAELEYDIRFQQRQAKFWRRVRWCVVFFTFIAATSLWGAVEGEHTLTSTITGALVVFFGVLDGLSDFSGKAFRHEVQGKRYMELKTHIWTDVDALDAAKATIAIDDPDDLDCLKVPSANDVCRSLGHPEYVQPCSFLGWLACRFA